MLTVAVTPSSTNTAKVPLLVNVAPTPDVPLAYVAVKLPVVATSAGILNDLVFANTPNVAWAPAAEVSSSSVLANAVTIVEVAVSTPLK